MQFEVSDISKVIPKTNYLLIRANKEERFLKLGPDMTIEIDTSFEPEKHSATYGEVISTCRELDDHLETEMEVLPGDIIYFHYLVIMNCIRDNKFVVCNGVPYFMVSYGSMFCCKRAGDVIPLNGYLLASPISEEATEQIGGIYLPESLQNKNRKVTGVVKHIGSPLKGQKNMAYVGDTICFTKSANVPLQYELHNNFEGVQTYYRMKHDNVLAILN